MDGNQAEGHLSFPFSKAMRSLSRSFAPSSVSARISTRSLCWEDGQLNKSVLKNW
jgi:hypothetical protein